ncbi:hypothetical protein BGZ70_003291 [Mortierella alpina]|uniref:Peptidase M10 metallopeptidase domain-containing protein n=1 Tax=Mortierella alpina TaxID=64518 RepID=A0A9P6ISL0_MORAP|nr:hypothetical protein BGZ70_003291 [Mortierella alpina]
MSKSTSVSTYKSDAPAVNPEVVEDVPDADVHVFRGHLCVTGSLGRPTPKGLSALDLRLHYSEGFVPLWVKNTILHYRFQPYTLRWFKDPDSAKADILKLLAEALDMWGDAAPVRFKEDADVWDFEIVVRNADECNSAGCVLASAFFPDEGRHELVIYPKMFKQTRTEQVETLIHELGHVFGLRHWFAHLTEKDWPTEVFGCQCEFSIMNYGEKSYLTPADKSDLALLYRKVWSGELEDIDGTRVKLFKSYSAH